MPLLTRDQPPSFIAATILQASKLPLTVWFLAFYLISQAKTGISSLGLSRHLGVYYDTTWLLLNKIMRAMSEQEESYVLLGKIKMDDAYLPLRGSPRARSEINRAVSQVEDRRTSYRSSPPSR